MELCLNFFPNSKKNTLHYSLSQQNQSGRRWTDRVLNCLYLPRVPWGTSCCSSPRRGFSPLSWGTWKRKRSGLHKSVLCQVCTGKVCIGQVCVRFAQVRFVSGFHKSGLCQVCTRQVCVRFEKIRMCQVCVRFAVDIFYYSSLLGRTISQTMTSSKLGWLRSVSLLVHEEVFLLSLSVGSWFAAV